MNAISNAHALTTDAGLTPSRIVHIGRSLSGISKKSIQFIEVPTVTYPANPNWVEFDTSQTTKLFDDIERDRAVHKTKSGGKGKAGKGGTGSKSPKTGPAPKLISTDKVNVNVLNGSGVQGIAGVTATALSARGFHILTTTSATTPSGAPDYSYTTSVVEYHGPADLQAAETVAAQMKNVKLREVSSLSPGDVTLILGSQFTKLGPPPSQPVGNLTGKFGGYKGSTNQCKGYGTAFTSG